MRAIYAAALAVLLGAVGVLIALVLFHQACDCGTGVTPGDVQPGPPIVERTRVFP